MTETGWIAIVVTLIGMLQLIAMWILTSTHKKISDVCQANEKDHDKLWRSLKHHGHTCCDEKNPKVYIEGAG